MNSIKKNARITGLLYLLLAITGMFSLMYVPSKIVVYNNVAATADNIRNSELLFRLGIVSNLICHVLFILLALSLYQLFKGINRAQARLMVILVLVSVPISFLNEINHIATLILLSGADFLTVFKPEQLNALVMVFLNLFDHGNFIAGIFWGLWLLPFGYLVYRSGFLPRIIGVLLIISCFSYLVESLTFLLIPQHYGVISKFTMVPSALGEFAIMFWLLIIGVNVEKWEKRATESKY